MLKWKASYEAENERQKEKDEFRERTRKTIDSLVLLSSTRIKQFKN